MTLAVASARLVAAVVVLVLGAACSLGSPGAGAGPTPSAPERLALVLDHTLYVQRVDGPRRALVTTTGATVYPLAPRWAPDGQRLAYIEKHFFPGQIGADWGDDIYVVPATGGSPELVRKHAGPGQQVSGLAWTPDGTALLLGDVRTGDGSPFSPATSRLVRYDLATRTETVLVEGAIEPSISADGQRIAYLQSSEGKLALMTAGADGKGARELVGPNAYAAIAFPRIAPDGRSVIFAAPEGVATRLSQDGRGWLARLFAPARAEAHGLPSYIWSVDVATGERRKVTQYADDDPCPAWLAGGESIVILSSSGLYRVLPSGEAMQRLEEGALFGQIDGR